MKSLVDAIQLRNSILQNFEAALAASTEEESLTHSSISHAPFQYN
jgi:hypothetical protein